MREFRKNITGRGASSNPENRFESQAYEPEFQDWENYPEDEKPGLKTQFLRDSSKSIVTENKSPDLPFTYSMNPYRGCEHGCAYCYARPTHEYLGFSSGLDFESKIMVKYEAARLLEKKLMLPSWKPEAIFMSGVTDCYQPIERKLKITRSCLEVLAKFKNPVALITKNALVTRDIDVLKELAIVDAAVVFLSVTSLDEKLARALEPRTSRPAARLEAIRKLSEAGIPVGVNVAPVIPGLTDHELPAILKACREAGAQFAGYTPLRLPLSVAPLFEEWLSVHRPERKEKVLSAIRGIRGGKLNEQEFGSRMRGEGPLAENIHSLFKVTSRRLGLGEKEIKLSTAAFQRPGDQLNLF